MDTKVMPEGIAWVQDENNVAACLISNHLSDVIIVGAGISGTLAATVLGRAGYQVTLVDRYETYPIDFRAEHLDGDQINQFARLGLLDELVAGVYRGETVACGRRGRLTDIMPTINFGLRYDQLVNNARRMLPATVTMVIGRVGDVIATDSLQQVQLSDGRILQGRLLIIASGLGYALCRQLGMTRRMVREGHSLTFGFNMVPKDKPEFQHSYVVYQGENIADCIDYLAIFRLGEQTRANLFTFRDYRDPWVAALRADPVAVLKAALPRLTKLIGDFDIIGKIEVRPMDLYATEGHVRAGVVLIGDAFQTACPAAGSGISKILTDVERLCGLHIPAWLRTEGMGRAKIASFYNDRIKRACDTKAAHDADYRRSVTIEPGLHWVIHRQVVHARRCVRAWTRQRCQSSRFLYKSTLRHSPMADQSTQIGIVESATIDHMRAQGLRLHPQPTASSPSAP